MDNVSDSGDKNTVKLQGAKLHNSNTPDRTTKPSSAMYIFDRPIRDYIPTQPASSNQVKRGNPQQP